VLPSGLPAGATINTDLTMAGRIIVTVSSSTALPAGPAVFANLVAAVPNNAPYSDKHLLDLTDLQINGGAISARDIDGVHVAAYFGDTTASGSYSSLDASLIARVAVGLDAGFTAFQLLEPKVIADISGNGLLSSSDTSGVLRAGVGLIVPEVPPLPIGLTVVASGPDPRLWLPTDLIGRPGDVLQIPIQLDSVVDLTGSGIAAADLVLAIDPNVFEFVGLERGPLVADFNEWMFVSQVDVESGEIHLGVASTDTTLEGTFADTLAWLQVRIKETAPLGASPINLLHQAPSGRQTLVNEGNLLLIPAISNDPYDPNVDGVVTILPPQNLDVNGDGRVSSLDALLVINRLHADTDHDRQWTAFDALQIINAMDEIQRRAVRSSQLVATGHGEASGERHSGGDIDHGHQEGLPYLSTEQANLPGGLEPLIQLLAMEANRPNQLRVHTAWRLA
jgi:hypothetical protein